MSTNPPCPAGPVEAYSPTGEEIIGTFDIITACAYANFELDSDGNLGCTFTGETNVYWDSQESKEDDNGETLYVDAAGDIWPESKLILKPIASQP